MRRIAEFLQIPIDDTAFDAQVQRCRIDEMREARRTGGFEAQGFDGGADSFYHRGGNGRGSELLTDEQLDRVERHTNDLLVPDAAAWITSGGDLPT
jgi:aryl sulfotransferase